MAFPNDLTRTKDWGTEILYDTDLEGQFDLIINWLMAYAHETTGHTHTGAENQSPKITLTTGVTGTLPVANGGTASTTAQTALNTLAGAVTANRLLKGNGTNIVLAQANLTTDVTGVLPVANGGTGQDTAQEAIDALVPAQGSAAGKFLKTDGTNVSWASAVTAYTDGALVESNATTERTTTASSYTKLKELSPSTRAGTVSISYEIYRTDAFGSTLYSRIYKNGSAFGPEHTDASTPTNAYKTYTDTGLVISVGDVIQVYAHQNGNTTKCKSLRILASNPTTPIEATGY